MGVGGGRWERLAEEKESERERREREEREIFK